jgi:Na+-transporting methylmalonyl-CoA/oxaloacetate decarboxylase gamma subunit
MSWLGPVVQLGIKAYLANGDAEKKTESIALEVKARVPVAIGGIFSFILFFASVIVFFTEIGRQVEASQFLYLSGTLIVVGVMWLLAAVIAGIGAWITRSRVLMIPKKAPEPAKNPDEANLEVGAPKPPATVAQSVLFLAGELLNHFAAKVAENSTQNHPRKTRARGAAEESASTEGHSDAEAHSENHSEAGSETNSEQHSEQHSELQADDASHSDHNSHAHHEGEESHDSDSHSTDHESSPAKHAAHRVSHKASHAKSLPKKKAPTRHTHD